MTVFRFLGHARMGGLAVCFRDQGTPRGSHATAHRHQRTLDTWLGRALVHKDMILGAGRVLPWLYWGSAHIDSRGFNA